MGHNEDEKVKTKLVVNDTVTPPIVNTLTGTNSPSESVKKVVVAPGG